MQVKLLIFLIFSSLSPFFAQQLEDKLPVTPHVDPTLKFTENLGQWNNNILFRSQLDGGALYIEKNCLTFSFYDKKKYRALHTGAMIKGLYKDMSIKAHAYRISFEDCN